jgi:uncharacterized protein
MALFEEIHLINAKEEPEGYSSLKFLVDGMLGSLATKLRILGFDTIYDKKSKDQDLISKASSYGLVLVTSDQELYSHAKRRHAKAILVKGTSEEKRLLEIFQKTGVEKLDLSRLSRCSACNSLLEDTGTKDDMGRSIFKCKKCGKSYWHGSHWKKLDLLFSNVNRSLVTNSSNLSTKQISKQKQNWAQTKE